MFTQKGSDILQKALNALQCKTTPIILVNQGKTTHTATRDKRMAPDKKPTHTRKIANNF